MGFEVSRNRGKVVIRANVETLPHHKTLILRGPEGRQEDRHARYECLPRQRHGREPPRNGAHGRHGQQSPHDENAIRRRIKNLAHVGHLVKATSHEAVNPISGPQYAEKPRGNSSMIRGEDQPEEDRQ